MARRAVKLSSGQAVKLSSRLLAWLAERSKGRWPVTGGGWPVKVKGNFKGNVEWRLAGIRCRALHGLVRPSGRADSIRVRMCWRMFRVAANASVASSSVGEADVSGYLAWTA